MGFGAAAALQSSQGPLWKHAGSAAVVIGGGTSEEAWQGQPGAERAGARGEGAGGEAVLLDGAALQRGRVRVAALAAAWERPAEALPPPAAGGGHPAAPII